MKRTKRVYDLTDETASPVRNVLHLTWPLFLEQVLGTLVGFMDTAMVGVLGKTASAAVSISAPVAFFSQSVIMATGVGFSALIAQSIGARDYERGKSLVRHALLLIAYVGIPICLILFLLHRRIPVFMGAEPDVAELAASYNFILGLTRPFSITILIVSAVFRGIGDTVTPLRINTVVNILNVIGNLFLINEAVEMTIGGRTVLSMPGFGMGVRGAALSTGLSWAIGGIVIVVILFRQSGPLRITVAEGFRFDRGLMRDVIKISSPMMLERMSMSLSMVVVTRAVAILGTAVIAANSIYGSVESLSFMPAFAFAAAATTLTGQSIGAGKPDLAVRYTYTSLKIATVIMTGAGVIFFLFAEPLVSILTPDREVISIAAYCLRIVAFVQPVQTAAWIFAGSMRGAGYTGPIMYASLFTNWVIRTAGSLICIYILGLGIGSTVVCSSLDNTCRMFIFHRMFRRGKWKKSIVTEG